ncbi:MAG: FtsQ-type POTRA domain-containing protein [Deltaproteobacteria bacterium]|nr:FtsQ-type POTRA domain-containing protein [Deltaproteobacteria bacterium]
MLRNKVNRKLSSIQAQKEKTKTMFKVSGQTALSLVCFFILIMGVYFFYQYLLKSSFFYLKEIAISPTTRVSHTQVLQLAHIAPHVNIISLNLKDVEKRIYENPWIKEVKLFRILPHKIKINLQEKEVFALLQKEKKLYYIEKSGELIKEAKKEEGLDFPIITSTSRDQEEVNYYQKALWLLEKAESLQYLNVKKISEIHLEESKGLTVYLLPHSTRVKMGSQNLEKKITRVEKVLDDLSQKHILAREIDLNFSKKVVVKTLKKS